MSEQKDDDDFVGKTYELYSNDTVNDINKIDIQPWSKEAPAGSLPLWFFHWEKCAKTDLV